MLIAIDLSNQEAVDTDPKSIQPNSFIGDLKDYTSRAGNADGRATVSYFLGKWRNKALEFSPGPAKVL